VVVVAGGVGIVFITNPFFAIGNFGGWGEVIRLDSLRFVFNFLGTHSILILADIFALFWIVWVINMVNFSTGVDGQMPGIVVITLFVIFAVTLRFIADDPSQILVARLAVIGAGATVGFLIFNFYPARIFPGDSASYFLGFLIAVLAIGSGAKVGTAILVMAVPLIDGVFTITRRLLSGKSPFLGDRGHLHHQLMKLGWGQRRISLFYWLVCAILGAVALGLHSTQKLFAGVFIVTIVIGGLLWLNINLSQKHQR
jgi:UDP-GlcNAc:undecaprenyl-phosphate GlcNAc-1-phosphate transferase